jgi:hypothetical protein
MHRASLGAETRPQWPRDPTNIAGLPDFPIRFVRRMTVAAKARFAVAAILLAACGDSTGPADGFRTPQNVEAVATSANSVRLIFSPVDEADSYRVERAVGDGVFTEVAPITTFYFDDTSLQPATQYRYRVAAVRGAERTPASAVVTATTQAAGSVEAVLVGPITTNRTLVADSQYVLRRVAKVMSGVTLTIQPGTTILGDLDAPPSLLLVGRGGRISANGTEAQPIVFTSSRPYGQRVPGDWGGIAIVGNATTNLSGTAFAEAPPEYREPYSGGTNDDDNSGTLRYVRIEFAGRASLANQPQNALTLLAVGRGTTIEYVQVMGALNDGFKWFGGTVDGRYLVSYEVGDDHFDASQGYRGRNQFLLALRTRRVVDGLPSGNPWMFELDGCEPDFQPCAPSRRPAGVPVFANFSVVDTRPSSHAQGWSGGSQFRDASGGYLVNGTMVNLLNWAIAIQDEPSRQMRLRDSLSISNLLLASNSDNFMPGQAGFWDGQNVEVSSLNYSQLFVGMPASPDPMGDARINWTPAAGSPLATGGRTTFTGTLADRAGTFIRPTSYRGAAAPGGPAWWNGWTVYYLR